MRSIKRILLAVPSVPESPALLRGEQLAAKLGATLNLLVCDARDDQGEFLDQQLARLRLLGIPALGERANVDTEHASSAILAACQVQEYDLIIKQHQPASGLKQLLVPPDDWQLVRLSPAPLLLVRSRSSWEGSSVLAAMDVEHHDPAHLALQGNVMGHASDLCELFGASLHVVSAYSPTLLPAADPSVAPDQSVARHCHDQCQWFQNEYEVPEHRLHIGEGPAKALIPQIARQLDATLVVLGTVARHGISGALLGNTAEAVLDHLDGDVLVLKPNMAHTQHAEPTGHRAA